MRECYTYNKRFKAGDLFPMEWLDADYLPNHHFMPEPEAREYLRTNKGGQRHVLCAGDDPRSNIELIGVLQSHGITNINPRWGRKEIWDEVKKVELQADKTGGGTKGRGK